MNKAEKQALKRICITLALIFALAIILTWCTSCADVSTTHWQDIGNNPCETTKIWPSALHYSAETVTTCSRDGKVVDVPTQHTDLTMLAAVGAVVAAIISVL